MLGPLFLAMPGAGRLADTLARYVDGEFHAVVARHFPDGESYVRVETDVRGRDVYLVARLSRPDRALLPLIFAARTVRALGARTTTLIAPYLPYLRQDAIFAPGEALSSAIFADLLSREADALITVDPHLHRYAGLDAIYGVSTAVVHSAGEIGRWIRTSVDGPLIVGPDAESSQWVAQVAHVANSPWVTFVKHRGGDRHVDLDCPNLSQWRDRVPVLVDDIVASGATVFAALDQLDRAGMRKAYCVAIHALFDAETGRSIARRTRGLLTTNSVPNQYSRFDVSGLIADVIREATR